MRWALGTEAGGEELSPVTVLHSQGPNAQVKASELHVDVQREQQSVSHFSFRSFIKSESRAVPSVILQHEKSHTY